MRRWAGAWGRHRAIIDGSLRDTSFAALRQPKMTHPKLSCAPPRSSAFFICSALVLWRGVDRHAGHKDIVLVALDRDGYELVQEGAEGLGILAAQEICLVPYAIVSQ